VSGARWTKWWSEVNSNSRYRFVNSQVKLCDIEANWKARSTCSALLVRFGVARSDPSKPACAFIWIAATTSVAMSFIAREGKVSFECCRPYKPTRRLSLGRSRQFALGATNPEPLVVVLIVQQSVPAVRIHHVAPRSPRLRGVSAQVAQIRRGACLVVAASADDGESLTPVLQRRLARIAAGRAVPVPFGV
jgi:hypothetical protein